MAFVTLTKLTDDDREQFILDNQIAFKYGAMEEFGVRDDHFEEDGEIISRSTIESSIDKGTAYRIREDGKAVGGLVVNIDEKTQHNHRLCRLERGRADLSANARVGDMHALF